MLQSFVTLSTFLALAAALQSVSATDSPHSSRNRSHKSLARRIAGDVGFLDTPFTDTRWTFFDVGLGACGVVNDDSDSIVALNAIQFGLGYPGPLCFKQITLEYKGKKATATITDMCPECPFGALDLSPSLFKRFAPEDIGVIYGQWYFSDNDDDNDDDDDSPAPHGGNDRKPNHKHKHKPKPQSKPIVIAPPKPADKQVVGDTQHSTPPAHAPETIGPLGAVTAPILKKLQQNPSSPPPAARPNSNGSTDSKNKMVLGGLPARPSSFKANTAPVVGEKPFQSEFGSKDPKQLPALNKFLRPLGQRNR